MQQVANEAELSSKINSWKRFTESL